MAEMNFIGEHLGVGMLGKWCVMLAFSMQILSVLAYFLSAQKSDKTWHWIGRIAFWVQSVSILSVGTALFWIIYNHYFEYNYAWAHSSTTLPVHYIISCFWEGQEGSFLLWAFWQMVLGNLIILTAKEWEGRVMAIIGLSQICILSMLLGIEVFGIHIGSSPFILLREVLKAPIFSKENYLSFITDGNGLNPLLQNYWMVIHPPTLFFGFASMVVPFAFAVAGLWAGWYKEWISKALPWALMACGVLGLGIIMGAFWAYESLNFGGFWNWDPVENASLIPWLTLVAGVHVMLAFKSTGNSYFTAIFLVMMSFLMVLYASFLTRSGILGETSVHAFTDLGMSGQLVIYLLLFVVLCVGLLVYRWKKLPITSQDEDTYSREFWLFVGALILGIACFQIVITTSIPVVNALLGTNIAPPINAIEHYNRWQTPFAILTLAVTALAKLLKFKKTNAREFWIKTAIYASISAVLTAVIAVFGEFTSFPFILLIFSCLLTLTVNANMMSKALKEKWKLSGSAVAHLGFGMMVLGALIAASKNYVVSINTNNDNYGEDFSEKNTRENILLFKGQAVDMDGYTLTYQEDSTSGPDNFYKINYVKKDEKGKVLENFNLYPNAQINPKMGLVANPDTKHYIFKDIYTHVSSVPNKEKDEKAKFNTPKNYNIKIGDSAMVLDKYKIKFLGIANKNNLKDLELGPNDFAVEANIQVSGEGHEHYVAPIFILKGEQAYSIDATVEHPSLLFSFQKINPNDKSITLAIADRIDEQKDFVIMKAIVFPFINLLWSGTIIMVIGFAISIWKRFKRG